LRALFLLPPHLRYPPAAVLLLATLIAGAVSGCSPDAPEPGGTTDITGGATADSGDGGDDDSDTTDGGDPDDTAPEAADSDPPVSYSGPSYEPCINDAECAPGDACVPVPGYASAYCAPACDPAGDAAECQLEGLGFDTVCTDHGRCARVCPDAHDPDAAPCPEGLDCAQVGDEALCAGELAGASGYYGLCSHPNVDGPDCPEDAACWGGEYLGIDEGMCLPWCPEYSCPAAPAGIDADPYCYDVGLEAPICLLLCVAGDDDACPDGQECYDLGVTGLCVPEGAQSPF